MSRFLFSKNLRDRIIRYFSKRGEILTQQQAEEYLHSMADLHDLVAEILAHEERSDNIEDGAA